jgi:hypothetical protein
MDILVTNVTLVNSVLVVIQNNAPHAIQVNILLHIAQCPASRVKQESILICQAQLHAYHVWLEHVP